ncbi:MAG: LysM peptidoglycan-binding domain-containing protein [Halomonas sp.]|uniref:LysM peptidoglycan-binding domain-containing protein n=1 Tax=Halomonas sp. TaxID=1486246 RepID=UPI003F939FA5
MSRHSGAIAGNWITIKQGDTLGEIAKQADVPLLRLQRFNPGVQSRELAVGQRILVPHSTERAPSGGPYRYRIRPGDTFSKVARHFGTSPITIVAANSNVDPSGLAVGQLVDVPLKSGTGGGTSSVARSSRKSATLPDPGPLPKTGTSWSWPLTDYSITRRFGKDSRGTLQPMLLSTNRGARASAVNDGEVRFADSMRQLGQVVIVHHEGNLQSVYANCKELLVKSGAKVNRGNPLCEVDVNERGQTELLFDMRHGGKPIDPALLLR